MSEVGMKHDDGKIDWTLLPWGPLQEVVKVMEFGAKLYARDNWQQVRPLRYRYLKAAFRHVIAYTMGETHAPDSGLHHLAHAVCDCLFIIWGDTHLPIHGDYHGTNPTIQTTSEATDSPSIEGGVGAGSQDGQEEQHVTDSNQAYRTTAIGSWSRWDWSDAD